MVEMWRIQKNGYINNKRHFSLLLFDVECIRKRLSNLVCFYEIVKKSNYLQNLAPLILFGSSFVMLEDNLIHNMISFLI